MPENYIVRTTALLGPPLTDRTYFQGEVISEADFVNCPHMWTKLLERGSVSEPREDEAARGEELRRLNFRRDFGLPDDADDSRVDEIVRLRREAATASRANEARQMIAKLQATLTPVDPQPTAVPIRASSLPEPERASPAPAAPIEEAEEDAHSHRRRRS